jgi:hypothetical protein
MEAVSYSNPRTRPNWTQHDTRLNGPKLGVTTLLTEKDLHQNNNCGRVRHDMDLRFDAYESRLQELSRKYLHA